MGMGFLSCSSSVPFSGIKYIDFFSFQFSRLDLNSTEYLNQYLHLNPKPFFSIQRLNELHKCLFQFKLTFPSILIATVLIFPARVSHDHHRTEGLKVLIIPICKKQGQSRKSSIKCRKEPVSRGLRIFVASQLSGRDFKGNCTHPNFFCPSWIFKTHLQSPIL